MDNPERTNEGEEIGQTDEEKVTDASDEEEFEEIEEVDEEEKDLES